MKNLMTRNVLDRFQFYLLCVVVVTFSAPMILNNIAIIGLLTLSIFKLKYYRRKFNKTEVIFVLMFLLSVVSIFFATDKSATLKSIEKSLVFLVFPLIFSSIKLTKKQLEKILILFALSTLTIVSIAFIMAVSNAFINGSIYKFNPENLVLENLLRYHRLSNTVGFHPTYLSIYTAFSMIILGCYLSRNFQFIKKKKRIFLFGSLVILTCVLYALNTFSVIFAIFLFLILVILFLSRGVNLIFLAVLASFGVLLIFYSKSRNNMDVDKLINYEYYEPTTSVKWNSVNSRLALWDCAIEVIKENAPFGTGKGNGRESLINKYENKGFVLGVERQYTSHNMYLTYGIELGFLGIILFLILIIQLFKISIISNSIILLGLTVLLSTVSLTEEVLELNKGIVFFSFFSLILSTNPKFPLFYEK